MCGTTLTENSLETARKSCSTKAERKIHMELGRKTNQVMLFREDMEGEVILLAQRSSLVSKGFELHIESSSLGI